MGLASAQPSKPNVIIFMADDMGIGDTSAYLGINLMANTKPIAKTLKTPNIEMFAKQGMIFTDAHAPAPCAARPATLSLQGGSPTGLT